MNQSPDSDPKPLDNLEVIFAVTINKITHYYGSIRFSTAEYSNIKSPVFFPRSLVCSLTNYGFINIKPEGYLPEGSQ